MTMISRSLTVAALCVNKGFAAKLLGELRNLQVTFEQGFNVDHSLDEWKALNGIYKETTVGSLQFMREDGKYELVYGTVNKPVSDKADSVFWNIAESKDSWMFRPTKYQSVILGVTAGGDNGIFNDRLEGMHVGDLTGCAWVTSNEKWQASAGHPWVSPEDDQSKTFEYLIRQSRFAGFIPEHSTEQGRSKYIKKTIKDDMDLYTQTAAYNNLNGLPKKIAKACQLKRIKALRRGGLPESDHIHYGEIIIEQLDLGKKVFQDTLSLYEAKWGYPPRNASELVKFAASNNIDGAHYQTFKKHLEVDNGRRRLLRLYGAENSLNAQAPLTERSPAQSNVSCDE